MLSTTCSYAAGGDLHVFAWEPRTLGVPPAEFLVPALATRVCGIVSCLLAFALFATINWGTPFASAIACCKAEPGGANPPPGSCKILQRAAGARSRARGGVVRPFPHAWYRERERERERERKREREREGQPSVVALAKERKRERERERDGVRVRVRVCVCSYFGSSREWFKGGRADLPPPCSSLLLLSLSGPGLSQPGRLPKGISFRLSAEA